jgi:hypothetical protein
VGVGVLQLSTVLMRVARKIAALRIDDCSHDTQANTITSREIDYAKHIHCGSIRTVETCFDHGSRRLFRASQARAGTKHGLLIARGR